MARRYGTTAEDEARLDAELEAAQAQLATAKKVLHAGEVA